MGVSEATYELWRARHGAEGRQRRWLKAVEHDNAQLKRLVVDKELENLALGSSPK